MNRYQSDKRMSEAKDSVRSKLTGQVEEFLLEGGKIEQVPGGKTGMTQYLRKLDLSREASERLRPKKPEGQA